jgi:hypothetical protein
MQHARVLPLLAASLFLVACGGGSNPTTPGPGGNPPPPAAAGSYVITAWSELGMHCMDGKDYSVFAVLPPYNTIHAQLVKRGNPPTIVTAGVTVTYEAMTDTTGSKNTTSASKTNFWNYVQALFLTNPAPDTGLAGAKVQSTSPHAMTFNAGLNVWEALGVPTIPYDDAGVRNPYPMAKIVARDSSGQLLATATVVLSVSDEMMCSTCHASGSNSAAQPAAGWENNPDPAKDTKYNILKKHDDRWNVSGNLPALQAAGYQYQSSLYQTAQSGTPILCAACHGTNALGAAGVAGVNQLTTDMHSLHGPVINPSTNTSLDSATTPFASCYLCHPGQTTKCQRGAMNKVACFDCHGNLTKVGAASRAGWLDEPSCQMCHNSGSRFPTTFDSQGNWRTTSDQTFATNANKPSTGKTLYRFSSGHGNLYCSSCHGSQHAEYPTLQPNDNLYSTNLQGYAGKIVECMVCHTDKTVTANAGPHGMHTVGQDWVSAHPQYANGGGYVNCAYCHGGNYTGTALSTMPVARTFSIEDGGSKTLAAGHQVSCYDCHNGPNGG